MIDDVADGLFGRHVGWRPDHHSWRGHPGGLEWFLQRPCNAEVGEEDVAVRHQNIFWLDIAMDDAVTVGVRQRIGELLKDPDDVVDREPAHAFDVAVERLAIDEWHHVEESGTARPRVEERQDVRVLQLTRRTNFIEKAFDVDRRGHLGLQDLECDIAIVFEIAREVDRRHPAASDGAHDVIPPGQCGRQIPQGVNRRLIVRGVHAPSSRQWSIGREDASSYGETAAV